MRFVICYAPDENNNILAACGDMGLLTKGKLARLNLLDGDRLVKYDSTHFIFMHCQKIKQF